MDGVIEGPYLDPSDGQAEDSSNVELTYLAEGAAHVVYRISLAQASIITHPKLVGKLFRFRKSVPSAVSCAESVSNYQNKMAPLFPKDSLVDLELHRVPDQNALITMLNSALEQRELNGTRPAKRRGIYLAPANEEPYAILVTDMTPRGPSERLIEFKPKWLVQSPSTPLGARRCRTCALREMRLEDERRTGEIHMGRGHGDFCPFDLLSSNDDILEETMRGLSLTNEYVRDQAKGRSVTFKSPSTSGSSTGPSSRTPEMDATVSSYKERVKPLLLRLRSLQAQYNKVGLDDFRNARDQHISVSMALRDCSVFVKLNRGEVGFQEVRLADLDLKRSGGGKLEGWIRTERRLIEEGWYMGTEKTASRGQKFCRALQGL